MIALALFALFALCALVSLLVLADSGLRAVDAWHRLRGELRVLSGECGTALTERHTQQSARVVRLSFGDLARDVRPDDWRAAA
jgi:hypothetical protein